MNPDPIHWRSRGTCPTASETAPCDNELIASFAGVTAASGGQRPEARHDCGRVSTATVSPRHETTDDAAPRGWRVIAANDPRCTSPSVQNRRQCLIHFHLFQSRSQHEYCHRDLHQEMVLFQVQKSPPPGNLCPQTLSWAPAADGRSSLSTAISRPVADTVPRPWSAGWSVYRSVNTFQCLHWDWQLGGWTEQGWLVTSPSERGMECSRLYRVPGSTQEMDICQQWTAMVSRSCRRLS